MADYVSDSDDEAYPLTSVHVRQEDIANAIVSFQSDAKGQQDAFDYLRDRGLIPSAGVVESDEKRDTGDAENLDLLKAYLQEQMNTQGSRRSLRKRNFSSTHPYLADQAHWLGLMDVDTLNEIYSETQDVESIVKLLNSMYMKKRKRYPREERYKPKSFYSFLGRNMPPQENQDEAFQSSQLSLNSQGQQDNAEPQNSDLNDFSYLELEDDLIVPHSNRRKANFAFLDEELEAEENDEESMQVEFPSSSTKSYSTKERILYHSKPRRSEGLESKTTSTRRGLAIKKMRRKAHRANNRGVLSLSKFIDDNEYDEESVETRLPLPLIQDNEYHEENVEPRSPLLLAQDNERSSDLLIDLTRDYDWSTDAQSSSDEESASESVHYYSSRPKLNSSNHISPLRENELFAVYEDQPRKFTDDLVNTNQRHLPRNKPKTRQFGHRPSQARLGPSRVLREKHHSSLNIIRRRKRTPKRTGMRNGHALTSSRATQANIANRGKQRKLTIQSDESAAPGTKFLQNVYQRTPNQSTTIFEATKTVHQKERDHGKYDRNSTLKEFVGLSMAPESVLNPIVMNDQNIKKLETLDTEHHIFFDKDSFNIVLFGQSFSFSIFDTDGSNRSFARVVHLIRARSTEQNAFSESSAEFREMSEAIKVLIKWSLVIQKPDNRHVHLVSDVIAVIFNLESINLLHIQLTSQFLLLEFIMLKICQRVNEFECQSSRRVLEKQCSFLFKACFQKIDFFQLANGENVVSLYGPIQIASTILRGGSDVWWSCITDAVLECNDELFIDGNILYGLSWLAMTFSRTPNWSAFLAYYRTFCKRGSNLEGSHLFLDVISCVGSKLCWPFDERLVLELYSSIGIRKFADYENENHSDFVLGKINTRSDIPDSTFFERYMLFLYSYVSALPFGSNKKRLITKLLTSSRFHYTSGSAHRAMFLNRLNFTILLCQLSDITLESQLLDLISQVDDSNDVKIYKLITEVITSLTEISLDRPELYPFLSLAHMVELVSKKYGMMPEMFKLWPSLNSLVHAALKMSMNESLYGFLLQMAKIYNSLLPDDITLDITTFLSHSYDSFPELYLRSDFIEEVFRNSLHHLNYHMGRYPLTNPNLEHRTEALVERLISLWVRSALLKGDQSWDVLILQSFPYIGNQDLREKFLLYFYAKLLESFTATGSYDTIIVSVMKQLARFSISKYFVGLLNQLIKNKHKFFDLKGQCGLELVTGLQFLNFRTAITSSILHNIASSESTSARLKQRYIEVFLESLNQDFGLFFLSQKYVTFCKKTTLLIQDVFQNSLSSSQTLNSLCVRLGIAQSKSTSNWTNLSFVQRLKIVNTELTTALSSGSGNALVLDSYVATSSMDVVYHLLGIYCQELLHHNLDKWPIMCHLLHYAWERLSRFKINGSEPNFLKFVKIVGITQALCRQSNYSKELEDSVKKASIFLIKILDHSRRMFDGYREQETILDVIYGVSQNSNSSTELDFMNSSLSNVRLYDIQTPDANMVPISADNLSIDGDSRSHYSIDISPDHEAPTDQACLICDL